MFIFSIKLFFSLAVVIIHASFFEETRVDLQKSNDEKDEENNLVFTAPPTMFDTQIINKENINLEIVDPANTKPHDLI